MSEPLRFTLDVASPEQVAAHLDMCDPAFVAELRERVDLGEYIGKIEARARRVEAWDGDDLVGLVALYANDSTKRVAFVTHVSVSVAHQSAGVARRLLSDGAALAAELGMRRLDLEVHSDNRRAKGLYSSLGFADVSDDGRTTIMSRPLESGAPK